MSYFLTNNLKTTEVVILFIIYASSIVLSLKIPEFCKITFKAIRPPLLPTPFSIVMDIISIKPNIILILLKLIVLFYFLPFSNLYLF